MNRHGVLPDIRCSTFKQMRFNIGFTPGTVIKPELPLSNHQLAPFTENKLYRRKSRRIAGRWVAPSIGLLAPFLPIEPLTTKATARAGGRFVCRKEWLVQA
jgi:hypothetical protein